MLVGAVLAAHESSASSSGRLPVVLRDRAVGVGKAIVSFDFGMRRPKEIAIEVVADPPKPVAVRWKVECVRNGDWRTTKFRVTTGKRMIPVQLPKHRPDACLVPVTAVSRGSVHQRLRLIVRLRASARGS